MRLFEGDSERFIEKSRKHLIAGELEYNFFQAYGCEPSQGEQASWDHSLYVLAEIFEKLGFHDHGIILEYQLPWSSKRLDCLISGKDDSNADNAVVIELKQWQNTLPAGGHYELVTMFRDGPKEVLHPSVQVGQYALYLKNVNAAIQNGIHLTACSFLHNYHLKAGDALSDDKFKVAVKEFPVFTADNSSAFESFLKGHLSMGKGEPIAKRIAESPSHINQKLMERVGSMIKGDPSYILLDDQKVAYDEVLHSINSARLEKRKKCIIVLGGPGTGKSVIAINLLADLSLKGVEAHYATGSKAFTTTLRNIVGRSRDFQFKYFNSYVQAPANSVPVIICDEAHRIRKSSANRWQRSSGKEQIDEIINAGAVTVFFLDPEQNVRPTEIGSRAYIEEHARKLGCDLFITTLETQFRCSGSDAYIKWLDNTLGIRKTDTAIWNASEQEYDFQIMDAPDEMEAALQQKRDEGSTSRVVAGFCWDWTVQPDENGELIKDIVIGDYKRPWNASDQAKGLKKGIPSSSLWAYDGHGADQVGCIYSVQGFEFDYIGVIVGKDITYDLDCSTWTAHPKESKDRSVKRADNFLELIKNTYRVLMTRGMKGCYVYFCDPDTRAYFESRIETE